MNSSDGAMDTREYLTRIRYHGETEPSHMVLSALQEAHLLSVPFENLDIHAGREILLDPARLFRKIVTMKRGGFCYELNALFYWLLKELGFEVKMMMGRVYDRQKDHYGPEFDHMLNLVSVDGKGWIVDVGFGDFSMHPLEFVVNQPLSDKEGQFLIEQEADAYFRISRYSEKDCRYWPEYIFSPVERRLVDFNGMCTYHQTSPASHFTQGKVCSIATETGRITLTDDRLIITDHGNRSESPIQNEHEFAHALATRFGIIVR